METYRLIDKDEALKIIENLDSNCIILSIMDFDKKEIIGSQKRITKGHGKELIIRAATIALNDDSISPHLDLFSIKQFNIRQLKKEGKIETLLFIKNGR